MADQQSAMLLHTQILQRQQQEAKKEEEKLKKKKELQLQYQKELNEQLERIHKKTFTDYASKYYIMYCICICTSTTMLLCYYAIVQYITLMLYCCRER